MEWITMKYNVKKTSDNRWQITGTKGYRIVVDNKYDAIKHCNFLNRETDMVDQFRTQNIEYYTALSKIKMMADQIQQESCELHIIELTIRIREIIRSVLP